MRLQWVLASLLVGLIVLDFLAVRAIVKSEFFTKRQVIAQILIVCLIPLFGAVFALVFLRSQYPTARQTERASPDIWQDAPSTSKGDHPDP